MPQVRFKGLVGQSYTLRNISYDCQQSINWYPEVNETQAGKNAEIAQLVPSPGLYPALTTVGGGASRGGYTASNGNCYWVFGTNLYQISCTAGVKSSFTKTLLYTGLTSGVDLATFTDNGVNLFITLGNNVFTTVLATGATSQLTADAYSAGASVCAYINERIVFARPDTQQFYWTDVISTVAQNLSFESASSNSDKVVGLISNNLDLWIFGKKTTELWYDYEQGNATFARRTNLLIETGCASPQTIKKLNNTIFWLSIDDRGGPMLMMANGYTPQRVSTYAIEQQWMLLSAADIERAQAFTWQEGGHHFYALVIPGQETTWVFDATVSQQLGQPTWHERKSYDSDMNLSKWLAYGHTFYNGFHITGDIYTDNLYIMDPDTYTDNGRPQIHQRTSPHISNSMDRIRFDNVTLDLLTGVTADLTFVPSIMMQYSDDGGFTWSNEYWVSAGARGDYSLKVQFQRLGMARNRVFRFQTSHAMYWALAGASIQFQNCAH